MVGHAVRWFGHMVPRWGWEVLGEVSADHGASGRADDLAALLAESCRLAAQVGAREMVGSGDPVASVHAVLADYSAPGFLVKRTGDPDERARGFISRAQVAACRRKATREAKTATQWSERARFGGCGAGLTPSSYAPRRNDARIPGLGASP